MSFVLTESVFILNKFRVKLLQAVHIFIIGTLYLFGGWNGTEDLDDLWSFNTVTERWSLLCWHSNHVGGPSPRSCHKMVLDPLRRRLYTLGRYLDNVQRVPPNMTVSVSFI